MAATGTAGARGRERVRRPSGAEEVDDVSCTTRAVPHSEAGALAGGGGRGRRQGGPRPEAGADDG